VPDSDNRTMSRCNRPSSPVTEGKRRKKELYIGDGKIHRVRLESEAICEVVNVVSPDLIWIRLANHISIDLRTLKPDPFEPLEKIPKVYDYVMAPLQQDIYARARVMNTKMAKEIGLVVYVHFIDEGYAQWVPAESLTAMSEKLHTHPWQALPVSLFRMSPGEDLVDYEWNDKWASAYTICLDDILYEYKIFRVVPIRDSRRRLNDYYEYARVELYGMRDNEDFVGESVAHRFALEIPAYPEKNEGMPELRPSTSFFDRSLYDARQQPLLPPDEDVPTIAMDMRMLNLPTDTDQYDD